MGETELKWKKFSTEELDIMLPRTYIGGHPKKDKKTIEVALAKESANSQKLLKPFFKVGGYSFMAAETHVDETIMYITALVVSSEKIPLLNLGMSMEKHLKEYRSRSAGNLEKSEEGLLSLQNYQAARLVMVKREPGGLFKKPGEIQQFFFLYSIRNGTHFWDFLFSTLPVRYESNAAIFDQAMHSVAIKVN